MECVIVAGNVKAFGKAIHSLAKIGIDLYIEALGEGLAIRTVNSSRSAYAAITFQKAFFQAYESGFTEEDDPGDTIKCIVDMKACLAIFKSLQTIEKSVQRCTLKIDGYANKIHFKLFCTHDIVHAYELVCIDSNPLQAVFSKNDCRNYISSFPRFLMNVFQSFQDEVTLSTTANLITLENYVEENQDPAKVLHTKLHLESEEFHIYNIREETSVTFSSKELKAALSFAEITDHPISIHFNCPGKPIVFVVVQPELEGDFVLATLDAPPGDDALLNQTTPTTTDEHTILRKSKETSKRLQEESTHVGAAAATTIVRRPNSIQQEEQATPSTSSGIRDAEVERIQQSFVDQDVAMTSFNDSNSYFAPPPHKRQTRSIFAPPSPCIVEKPDEVLASDTDDEDDDAFDDT